VALTINERAAVAVFAVRLQTPPRLHCDKINLCCNIVEQARAGATPKDIYQSMPNVTRHVVYRVISRARHAGLLPAFKPILIAKARSTGD
jgi:hypothetical protein